MIYFLLPSSPKTTFNRICIATSKNEPHIAISQSVAFYMNEIKEKIASREKEWDVIKKYTNPYEYIHSIVPLRKKSISKYKPLSRSFFKMIEILSAFRVDEPHFPSDSKFATPDQLSELSSRLSGSRATPFKSGGGIESAARARQPVRSPNVPLAFSDESLKQNRNRYSPIKTFHLAEGPGGFIEAVCNKRANPDDVYTGMTILYDETDDNVPAWNKTEYFLSKNPNVFIETGADRTGNIMRMENFDHCVSRYGSSMDLITADGGFDFSKDFNKQELIISNLMWGQTCYALCMQKYGGNFVLKIFDCFYEQTVDILYILSAFYTEVNICKLQTSRLGNSEKYVVCRGFRMTDNTDFLMKIRESFRLICQNEKTRVSHLMKCSDNAICSESALWLPNKSRLNDFRTKNPFSALNSNGEPDIENLQHVSRFLDCSVPRHFVKRVEEMNAVFGTQQIENIHYTISIIDKNAKYDRLEQLTKQNIQKCIVWCVEHGISYNNFSNTNIFVSDAKPETKQMEESVDTRPFDTSPPNEQAGCSAEELQQRFAY